MIPQINSSLFDWLTWRNGTLLDIFGVSNRTYSILSNKRKLIKHAVGWAKAESIPCRPKENHIAVMFYYDDNYFWTHLTKNEFNKLFKE